MCVPGSMKHILKSNVGLSLLPAGLFFSNVIPSKKGTRTVGGDKDGKSQLHELLKGHIKTVSEKLSVG